MDIYLANPRGFCAGVDRAIDIVRGALSMFDETIYVRHEVVHNRHVVNNLIDEGVIFVEDLDEIPNGSVLIFSAHGVSQAIRTQAKEKNLQVFDATCPLVTKVHMEVARYSRQNYTVILIGHKGHPEVEGTLGQYSGPKSIHLVQDLDDAAKVQIDNSTKLAYVTQTTLSVDETQEIIKILLGRFPDMISPPKQDICYATTNRQNAVKELAHRCDVILVVGSQNSSNSNRLVELARKEGCRSWLIDSHKEIQPEQLLEAETIGITAGASAPELLVQDVVDYLKENYTINRVHQEGEQEDIVFSLPMAFRKTNPGQHTSGLN